MKNYIENVSRSIDSVELKINNLNIPYGDVGIFQIQIDSFSKSIFKNLCHSILTGEYIENTTLNNTLNNIKEKLAVLGHYGIPPEFQNVIQDFSITLSLSIKLYSLFIKEIESKYNKISQNLLFSYNPEFEYEIKNNYFNLSNNSKELIEFFNSFITLNEIDHNPSNERNFIVTLHKIEETIKRNTIAEYTELKKLICLKIDFLKHKWDIREQKTNKKSILEYLREGTLNRISEYTVNNNKLKEWSDKINYHYQIDKNWKEKIIYNINENKLKNKELNKLTIYEIHNLIKYHKDIYTDIEELTKIFENLYSINNSNIDNYYDNYAYEIISNYALNNRFSAITLTSINIDELKLEYEKAKKNTLSKVNNFFLDYKYLNAIIRILNTDLDNDNKIQNAEKWVATIEYECKELLKKVYLSKEWTKINFNYIFLLPFKESIVPVENNDEVDYIFIASSFILPPPTNKIEEDYNEVKENYDKLKIYHNTILKLKKDLVKIEDLNKEIEKRDFKSIEIISIFTAIITFVLASIPGFKFVEGIYQALLFMLALASSLGIFVILILSSTRGFKNYWIGILILSMISFVGYQSLIGFDKEKSTLIQKEINRLDSLRNISLKNNK